MSRVGTNNRSSTMGGAGGGGGRMNNHHLSHLSMNHDGSSVSGSHSLTEDYACGDPNAPTKHDFMVSFLVDARGGSMYGCRYSGVKVRSLKNESIRFCFPPIFLTFPRIKSLINFLLF